jgi:hypothetical protein
LLTVRTFAVVVRSLSSVDGIASGLGFGAAMT